MSAQHHNTPTHNDRADELLHTLIVTPPALSERRLRPMVLRSAAEQRRYALRGYLLRTWFDVALGHAERLLLVAVALFFLVWAVDGPLRDWWHLQQASTTGGTANVQTADDKLAVSSDVMSLAPLPYTRPTDGQADLLIPRQPLIETRHESASEPNRLQIPAIELDTPIKRVFIVDGTWEVAEYAAGHLNGTGLPGEPGNMALAGHAGLRGAVFGDLGKLATGDDIFIDSDGWQYHYRVRESKHVWPTQVEVLEQTQTAVVTLITCTNWDTQRLVVVADLVGAKPSPGV